jgi:hypothetical protein
MTVRPRTPIDLALAPVAVAIDANLERFRDVSAAEIDFHVALELDRPERFATVAERAERVVEVALRNVELHGWKATITDDCCRLHLTGGSVSVDIGLSANIMDYVSNGAGSQTPVQD